MSYMLQVKDRTVTLQCTACPSAWNVETLDGRSGYIRYRFGGLSVNVFHDGRPTRVWEKQVGGEWDGIMSEAEMRSHLAGVVEFVQEVE